MKPKVLLIAKKSFKAEALVRYWPADKWDLQLYTYRRKEWFPGMSEQFGKNWSTLLPAKGNGSSGKMAANAQRFQANTKIFMNHRKKIRKYLDARLIRFYDQKLVNWLMPSLSNLKLMAEIMAPDIVLSIYEPLAANLIARKIASNLKIPWIAYFRDHCTTHNDMFHVPGLWHLQSAYDRQIHAPLDALVGVSPQFVDILSSFYKIPRSKSHTITGVFDDRKLPMKIRERCKNRRRAQPLSLERKFDRAAPLKVCYVGNIYRHQIESLLIFLKSLFILSQKKIPIELRLVLSNAHYFFPEKVRLAIDQLRNSEISLIFDSERIVHEEALKLLDSSDVNVILEGRDFPHSIAGTLTSKIFDLMMIAKPSLAICAPTLPIGDYLRETGIGKDRNDLDGVVRTLLEVWSWKQGEAMPDWYSPKKDNIEQYSCRSMAIKMSELCEEVYNHSLHHN